MLNPHCLPSASPFSPASLYVPHLPIEDGGTQSQCPQAHALQGAEQRPNTMQRSEWTGLPSQWAFSAGTSGWVSNSVGFWMAEISFSEGREGNHSSEGEL